jgi:hypothetical protein
MIQRITQSFVRPLAVLVLGLGLVAAATAGCEPPQLVRDPSAVALPRWEGHAREVFDDNIDPAAVGLTMEGASPRSDAHLRERAQMADVVARVRVQTVTVDSIGDQKTYHLGLQVGVPTLTEAKVPDRNFELSIKPTSGAFGIARSFDARLRGQTFVGFIKRYSDDGDVALHWHLAPDTAEVAAAVKEAVVLREISGS